MADLQLMNDWTVSGEVFYLKKLEGEFAASVKLRGISCRDGASSTQILEFPCIMQARVYNDARKKGIDVYRKVTLSGHVESWHRMKANGKDDSRIMFIVDYCLGVQ